MNQTPNDLDDFSIFFDKMLDALDEHKPLYGDSWREMSEGKLYDRVRAKFTEFELTYNKDKLISLANLAMLLYIRMNEVKQNDITKCNIWR